MRDDDEWGELIPEAVPRLRELVAQLVGPSVLWPLVVRDAMTVRGLQDAVIDASPDLLRDDATLLVIAPR